jgi:hypothetical protein
MADNICGRSSVVEYRLPKPWVASSNLVARSRKQLIDHVIIRSLVN